MVTIYPDRVTGGTSRKSGQLELMVERKIAGQDNKGVVENLNDPYKLEVTHNLKICLASLERCKTSRRVTQINRENELLVVETDFQELILNTHKVVNFPVQHMKMARLLNREGLESVRIDFYTKEVDQDDTNQVKYVLRFYNYGEQPLPQKYKLGQILASLGVQNSRVAGIEPIGIEGWWIKEGLKVNLEEKLSMEKWSIKAYLVTVNGMPIDVNS